MRGRFGKAYGRYEERTCDPIPSCSERQGDADMPGALRVGHPGRPLLEKNGRRPAGNQASTVSPAIDVTALVNAPLYFDNS